MVTLLKRLDAKDEEVKNIKIGGVENDKFYYYNIYDQLCEIDQVHCLRFVCDNKKEAIEIVDAFRCTKRFIAILVIKNHYYVCLDVIPGDFSESKIIRKYNFK